jgi:head-tail adaptor
MLDDNFLQHLRNAALYWLKETCNIEKQSDTLDETGSPIQTWDTVASNVPCRVITAGQSSSSAAAIVGSAESMTDLYKIVLPANTSIDINCRITVNGETFNIVRLETALTDEVYTQAIITRQR